MNASLNLDIIQHCQTILDCEAKTKHSKKFLFEDHKKIFYERIALICEQLSRGNSEDQNKAGNAYLGTCLKNKGIDLLMHRKYPANEIDFEIKDQDGQIEINAEIKGIDFDGECSNYANIQFPLKESEFEQFLNILKGQATSREMNIKLAEEKRLKAIEEKEREQLKLLREKYETGG